MKEKLLGKFSLKEVYSRTFCQIGINLSSNITLGWEKRENWKGERCGKQGWERYRCLMNKKEGKKKDMVGRENGSKTCITEKVFLMKFFLYYKSLKSDCRVLMKCTQIFQLKGVFNC